MYYVVIEKARKPGSKDIKPRKKKERSLYKQWIDMPLYRRAQYGNDFSKFESGTSSVVKAGAAPGWIGARKPENKEEKRRMAKRQSRERKQEKAENISLYGSDLNEE
jgi:hypothetical protein